MINMDQYEYIRIAHRVYRKNISEIERETVHDRKTIRKVLNGEYSGYSQRQYQPFPVIGPYREIIDEWLSQDKDKPKKQRHTARRIYNRLVCEQNFMGSESTIRHYIRGAKIRLGIGGTKVFIPLDPECGQEAEIDWGNALANIKDKRTVIRFFCMRSRYSGKHFVRAYLCERQQAFFDAHIHGFHFFGGVFPTLVYDNLTSAVKKVLVGKRRIEQDSFIKFRSYYNFTPRFCNTESAHEKGGVEGMVGFVRRNYMVPLPCVEDIEELNHNLFKQCLAYGSHRISGREKTVNELFEHERTHLIPIPPAVFSNIQTQDNKVDHYSTVFVDKNHYSVPGGYAGLKVHVNIYIDRIEIFHEGKKIATHKRVFGNNKWQLNPQHYLEVLQQKPGAFHTARPIKQWRESWPKELESLLRRFQETQGETLGIKDFITVLLLYRDYPADEIRVAIELSLENHVSTSAGVKHILLHYGPDTEQSPLLDWPSTILPDLGEYALLGGVQ